MTDTASGCQRCRMRLVIPRASLSGWRAVRRFWGPPQEVTPCYEEGRLERLHPRDTKEWN